MTNKSKIDIYNEDGSDWPGSAPPIFTEDGQVLPADVALPNKIKHLDTSSSASEVGGSSMHPNAKKKKVAPNKEKT